MENLVVGLKQAKGLASAVVGILAVFALVFGNITIAEEKKKKPRRVPAISQSLYKQISEAQIMIDPDSIPREEGARARA